MPDNLWETKIAGGKSGGQESGAMDAAPPPPEVKVRTMRSDLEEMAKGGGTVPEFQTIKAPDLGAVLRGGDEKPKKKTDWFLVAVFILAAALFSGIVYIFYSTFSTSDDPAENARAPLQNLGQPVVSPQADRVVHTAIFKRPADEIITFVSRGRAESASELQTFNQKLISALSAAKADSEFIEIYFKNDRGGDLSADEILSLSDALVFPREFLLERFNHDATAFVYKNKEGFWPGYILELKTGENWLFLQSEISRLEFSLKIENFFLQAPGTRSGGGFEDTIIGGQPARRLNFSSSLPAQAGNSFIYSRFRDKIILATSEAGLIEALARL